MLKYMLDTNIVIYIIKQRPPSALAAFNQHASQLCISTITLAELYHGVEKSLHTAKNLNALEDFTSRLEVLTYAANSAAHYGDIRAQLEKSGQTIGVNDLHIAAHARSQGLILVTNNTKEFERVKGLRVENWV